MSVPELLAELKPFAESLGRFLGSFDSQKRKSFRDLRGAQGRDVRMRECQFAIRQNIPEFQPTGLDEFLERSRSMNNSEAQEVIREIETRLQKLIIGELKRRFGDDDGWWRNGVHQKIRLEAITLMENDNDKRGGREYYFNLIHYKKIAADNWEIFRPLIGNKEAGNSKDKQLAWLDFVNEKRNETVHASSGKYISTDDLNELRVYLEWFREHQKTALEDFDVEANSESDDD